MLTFLLSHYSFLSLASLLLIIITSLFVFAHHWCMCASPLHRDGLCLSYASCAVCMCALSSSLLHLHAAVLPVSHILLWCLCQLESSSSCFHPFAASSLCAIRVCSLCSVAAVFACLAASCPGVCAYQPLEAVSPISSSHKVLSCVRIAYQEAVVSACQLHHQVQVQVLQFASLLFCFIRAG